MDVGEDVVGCVFVVGDGDWFVLVVLVECVVLDGDIGCVFVVVGKLGGGDVVVC